MSDTKRILFLCTGNSCRSQMAEGWCRAMGAGAVECASAGLEAHGLNPNAVQVMREAGVDISDHASNTVEEVLDGHFNLVVTVCGHAHEHCPAWPGTAEIVHMPFDDPPALAREASSDDEAIGHYRRVRDEIREAIATLLVERTGLGG